jgi:uncharacterized protein
LLFVVLDTNVIVSGLLKEKGIPSKIIDLALSNQFQLVYDDRILTEYEEVLSRQELHISQSKANAVITYIELSGLFIEDVITYSPEGFPDQKDLPFIEVFIASKSQAMVTGNIRHFKPLIDQGLPVMTPSQFIEAFFPNQ